MAKAVTLLSGGLDSILATKLILEQGIEVEAVNFLSVFYARAQDKDACLISKSAADKLGVKLKIVEFGRDYLEIIKNPKYGYGSNMNPCLDCRIFMFKKAAQYMRKIGASFLISGEVLGERPMSQRRDAMRIIDRQSNLKGLVLRPLSAKLLEPTIAEEKDLVDREKLLAIQGRSRKPQIELASHSGINDYPSPAGGCLLTDPGFANRMRDLMKYKPGFSINDVQLLKIGRHFRLASGVKLIVGRNQKENNKLLKLVKKDDYSFQSSKVKGPVAIGRGTFNKNSLFTASSIVARYSDGTPNNLLEIEYRKVPARKSSFLSILPLEPKELEKWRI